MAGRRLRSMQDGWLGRGEERRILATTEMDLDLGEGAEVVEVGIGGAEVEVLIMVLVVNMTKAMTKASRVSRWFSDSALTIFNLYPS